MKYSDGQDVRLGDVVKLGQDSSGVVVCSIDSEDYSDDFPRSEWGYLERGVLIKFSLHGVIHYEQPEPELQLVARAESA